MRLSTKGLEVPDNINFLQDLTLKDIDLENLVSRSLISIAVRPEDLKLILKTIARDTEFFKSQGIMDYSILLGVEEVKIKSKETLFLDKMK